MKSKFLYILFLALISFGSQAAGNGFDKGSCSFKGKKLYGKVKIVEHFEDIRVMVVENFEDLKVKQVNNFANSCGRWQVVENFEDIKIKFVSNFADIKIKYVEHLEGVR